METEIRMIKITLLSVCSKDTSLLFMNIMEDLEKIFQSYLPLSLKYIEIFHKQVVQNTTRLTELIFKTLKTTDIIILLGPASMHKDITNSINKIADEENKNEQFFTKISDHLKRPNIQFSNYIIQNKKLIFFTTGSKTQILNNIRQTADAMVLCAHYLKSTIQLQTTETSEHNILGLQVIEKEDDTKKKTQEKDNTKKETLKKDDTKKQKEDEILSIPQSRSLTPLELNPSERSDSILDENVSNKMHRETSQSELSVTSPIQLQTAKTSEHNIDGLQVIEEEDDTKKITQEKDNTKKETLKKDDTKKQKKMKQKEDEILSIPQIDTKKKTQEKDITKKETLKRDDTKKQKEDEILSIPQSRSPTPLELNPSERSDSILDENVSNKMHRETSQSEISVASPIQLQTAKTSEHNIDGLQVIEEKDDTKKNTQEKDNTKKEALKKDDTKKQKKMKQKEDEILSIPQIDTKKKTQEKDITKKETLKTDDTKKQKEDEILSIPQSRSPTPLELNPSERSDSILDENVSNKMHRETSQSEISVASPIQLQTAKTSEHNIDGLQVIEEKDDTKKNTQEKDNTKKEALKKGDTKKQKKMKQKEDEILSIPQIDTKKKTQEKDITKKETLKKDDTKKQKEDEILSIPQSRSPTPLELNSSKRSDSILDKNVSNKMRRETSQSELSVTSPIQLQTAKTSEHNIDGSQVIKEEDDTKKKTQKKDITKKEALKKDDTRKQKKMKQKEDEILSIPQVDTKKKTQEKDIMKKETLKRDETKKQKEDEILSIPQIDTKKKTQEKDITKKETLKKDDTKKQKKMKQKEDEILSVPQVDTKKKTQEQDIMKKKTLKKNETKKQKEDKILSIPQSTSSTPLELNPSERSDSILDENVSNKMHRETSVSEISVASPIQLQTAETSEHNIDGLQVIEEENDTKKNTQEKDDTMKETQGEILNMPRSRSLSTLELNPSERSDSIGDENALDEIYRATHESEFSVISALSLIKQTVTESFSVPVGSEFINIKNAFTRISYQTCRHEVSVEYALLLIEETVTKDHIILNELESEFVTIENAFSRISFETEMSYNDVPQFRVATKSGYTVIVDKKANEIEVRQNELNEDSPIKLDTATFIFVAKGDRIPLDTVTAVIPEENVFTYIDEAGKLNFSTSHKIKYGQNIMFPGSDFEEGEIITKENTHIFSRELMLLTASGCKNIKVHKKLSIGVMAIGNESNLEQSFKYSFDCNRLILISLLEENNFDLDILDLGTTNDPKDIIENITTALEDVDLLVTTGHFSDKDYVKNILKNHFNTTFLFENVDMKPGKSTAFASCYFRNKPKIILCLPGNPASVFVTAYLFFLPLIKWMHFIFTEDWPKIYNVEVDQTLLLHSRPRYVWANLSWSEGEWFSKVICNKERSINNDLSDSNGNALIMLPPKTPEKSTLEVSSRVSALLVKFPFLRND